jgi:hypothetical protein
MTYKELAAWLLTLTHDQLNMDVTVHDLPVDEFWPVVGVKISTDECDVLDPEHPVLEIET